LVKIGGQFAEPGVFPVSYTNFSEAANTTNRVVAKIANQGNVKAKFNYIPALWYSNLAVQKQTS
jgi:hypothetical protein